MNHIKHPLTNFTFNAPPGMNNCDDLAVVRGTMDNPEQTPVIMSYWKPTPEEIAELNAGGYVRLTIVGTGMPPVALATVDEACKRF